MKLSADYHDYVFKNGRLLGKFDDMYKFSSSIPWDQDVTVFSPFSDIDIAILKQLKYDSVCEVGCGLGYFTDRLSKELHFTVQRPKITGIDISKTAIGKAAKKFPGINFISGDLLATDGFLMDKFNVVIAKEVMWYVCHRLDLFFRNILRLVKKNGYLYVSQSFPNDNTWVGKEMLDSPEALKKILCKYAEPVHCCIEYNDRLCKNGHIHFLGKVQK